MGNIWDEEVPAKKSGIVKNETESKKEVKNELKKEAINADEAKVLFSDDRIKQWLFGAGEKSISNVCCALYGFDGTAKSGIALDCRTEKEKKDGLKVVVFDLDGGCSPLKLIYHNNDPNIIIKNPIVRNELKNIDYEMTFLKLKSSLDYIERNIDALKIKAIVFDGLDRFLKICEYSMREEIGKEVVDGIDFRYWKIRNMKYNDVVEQIKLMDIDRYFITHLKQGEDDEWLPDWEKKTSDIVYQKLRCFKESETTGNEKIVYIKAEVEKCKTNIGLEGKIFTIAKIVQTSDGNSDAKWYGLYFNKNNTITQKKVE